MLRPHLGLTYIITALAISTSNITMRATYAFETLTCQVDGKQMITLNKSAGIAANTNAIKTPIQAQKFADLIKQTGTLKTTRSLRWDAIEQTKDKYDWDTAANGSGYADTVSQKLPANTLIFKLVFTPKWASTQPNHPKYWGSSPQELDAWENFVKAAVNRYGKNGTGKVTEWEVWNEPNINEYWWGTQDEYLKLLNTTYDSIKASDENAVVWGPSMVFWQDTFTKTSTGYKVPAKGEPKYEQHKKLWEMFYLVLEQGKFDGFSYHVYGDTEQTYNVTKALKEKLKEYPQHSKKKIMLSETNLNVGIPSWEKNCPYGNKAGLVNETQKRQILQQRYACTFNAGADIVLWFPLQSRVNKNCYEGSLNDGIVRADLSPLPVAKDLENINKILSEAKKTCEVPKITSVERKCTKNGYQVQLTWNSVQGSTQYIVAYDDDNKFWSDFHKKQEFGQKVTWAPTSSKTTWTKRFSDNIPRFFAVRVGKNNLCTPNMNIFSESIKLQDTCQQ